ncbi:carotenoid biosynthesis protein [Myxococcota bacterium]|nr:carotenoid biosynthesis protein [Myxococcota bacterium]
MVLIEIYSAIVVIVYIIMVMRLSEKPLDEAKQLATLSVAAWIGENSVIHAYHFYAYSPEWSVFVDQVPLLVILIWPVVIHSAWGLARRLPTGTTKSIPLFGALIVLADASLIEPIAVHTKLWWWFHPGLFDVPLIGILGWAIFAFAALFILESRHQFRGLWALLLISIAPLVTHLLLLISWWGFFKHVEGTIYPWAAVAVVWAISLFLARNAHTNKLSQRMNRMDLLLRIPGASLFFILLLWFGREEWALWAYALAFVPTYLIITPWREKPQII